MALSDLFTSSAQDYATTQAQNQLLGGKAQATGAIQGGLAQGLQSLTGGTSQAVNTLEGAKGYYAPLVPGAQNAWQLYQNLIGAGDPSQVEATLTSQPGFQTQMDLALQAANRTSAAGGMGASGNAIMSAMDTSRGLEEANINNYASRLMQMAGYAPQFAGAQAGISGTEAGYQYGAGQTGAQMNYGAGTAQAGIDTSTAAALADTYQKQADARMQAAKNVWDGVMAAAGLGVKVAFPPKAITIPTAGTATG
jgi:hypothetical protein